MTMDYSLLGKSKKIQQRRYKVLSLMVKGGTPDDITRILQLPFKTVDNDMAHIRKQPLHTLSSTIAKDLNNSAYELKIRELETKAETVKHDTKAWAAIQKLILDARAASLKLQGLMNDKVVHSGEVTNILEVRYEDRPKDNDRDKTQRDSETPAPDPAAD